MKRGLAAAAIVAGAVAALWAMLPEAPARIGEGDPAVDFQLPDLQGTMRGLPRGEVVLLNFWATWCPPCREEMPSMARLSRTYRDRGLKVVAVSVDGEHADVAGFVREYELPFLVLRDVDNVVARRYGVVRFPETFLIDRRGVIRQHVIGAVDWMSEPVRQMVEGVLDERPGGKG